MFRFERQHRVKIGLRLLRRLSGQAKHQIQIEILESLSAGDLYRCSRIIRRVDTSEPAQGVSSETLHTNGEPIDARRSIVRTMRRSDCARIRFEGDFRIRTERDAGADAIEQAADGRAGKETRRAATDKDGADGPLRRQFALFAVQIAQQPLDIGRKRRDSAPAADRMRVEITIRTFAHTPGQMDIERQRRRGGRHAELRRPRLSALY